MLYLFAPAADGSYFEEDKNKLEVLGKECVYWEAPYLVRSGNNLQSIRRRWDECVRNLKAILGKNPFVGIGKNLGGSMLVYAQRHELRAKGIIVAGAVPNLSEFAAKSNSKMAQQFRDHSKWNMSEYLNLMQDTDLYVNLLETHSSKYLLQVGTKDPWIEMNGIDMYNEMKERGYDVRFYSEGHKMESTEAIEDRINWVTDHF